MGTAKGAVPAKTSLEAEGVSILDSMIGVL
jgi:hypothetical protein